MRCTLFANALALALALTLAGTTFVPPARAATVTVAFSGTINNDPFGLGVTTFSGSYSFDNAAADLLPADVQTGSYASLGPLHGIEVSFDGGALLASATGLSISVANDYAGPRDQLTVLGTSGFTTIELFFEDLLAAALATDALPAGAPPLAAFGFNQFRWFYAEPGNEGELFGVIQRLDCVAGCPTVPLPGTAALAGLGVLFIGFTRRRSMTKLVRRAAALCLGLAGWWLALPAHAVDGVILIDQAKALAGNVTPGDAPGFPVTISRAGSYRLSSDLVVADASTSGIEVTNAAGEVTIDLNGFSISGPVTCLPVLVAIPTVNPVTSCAPKPASNDFFGPGSGIQSVFIPNVFSTRQLVVRNGSIRGMGRHGIQHSSFSRARVEGVTVANNGGIGLSLSGPVTVVDNLVEGNLGAGIGVLGPALVRGNLVVRNGRSGILVSTNAGVTGNVVHNNGQHGLEVSGNLQRPAYSNNQFMGNLGSAVDAPGGVHNTGGNSCDGVACP